MKLEGVHHVTAITGDAPRNVEFYAGTLGLRLVKKTVNQDDPTVYHLFYADELGSAGADITFFEYPGAPPGRAGDGMVHRVVFRVGSRGGARLLGRPRRRRARRRRRSSSPTRRGSRSSSSLDDSGDEPLVARHPEIPEELAIRGFAGVRAYAVGAGRGARRSSRRSASRPGWETRGEQRGGFYVYDPAPGRGISGGGHRAPRRLGLDDGRARGLARSASPRPAAGRRR